MTNGAPFPEVRGHAGLKSRLSDLLEGDRLGMGILIVGEEGRGKRTLAHAFAREILERAAPPAEKARIGKLIASGAHPGLVHVEPLRDERFHPVRRIRRLLESCSLKVGLGDRRVVILARVHAVNEESGNTLLKFLEEPPSGTLVVATARDRAAVLETIRSRFLILPAGPLERDDLDAVLERGGHAIADRPVLGALSRGAPGRAWGFARGDVAKALLEPVRMFFDPATPIHGAIEALVKTARDLGPQSALERERSGPPAAVRALADLRAAQAAEVDDERKGETTLESARVWVKPIVEAVAYALQELLREKSGAGVAPPVLAPLVVPAGSAMRNAPIARVTQALGAAVTCLENIDHNLTLTLALEAFALRLRAA